MENDFYCSPDFDIDEWDALYKKLEQADISEEAKQKLLFPGRCKEQCINCMAAVQERRDKTQKILRNDFVSSGDWESLRGKGLDTKLEKW